MIYACELCGNEVPNPPEGAESMACPEHPQTAVLSVRPTPTGSEETAPREATRKEYIVVTHEENGTSKRAYRSKQLAFDAISESIARGWTIAAAYERVAQLYTKENFPEMP